MRGDLLQGFSNVGASTSDKDFDVLQRYSLVIRNELEEHEACAVRVGNVMAMTNLVTKSNNVRI
jgi:hypothetical protein